MINRRGDIAVTLLIFMIVVLFGYSLFSFYKGNNNAEKEITDARFAEAAQFKEEIILYNLGNAGENAAARAYLEILNEGIFSKIEEGMGGGDIDRLMDDKISAYLKKEPAAARYIGNNLDAVVFGDEIEIHAKNIPLASTTAKDSKGNAIVLGSYNFDVNVTFNLENKGLQRFDKIFFASKKCVKDNNRAEDEQTLMLKCLQDNMNVFNVNLRKEGNNFVIDFSSKKEFLLDEVFRKAVFTLKLDENGVITQ